MNNYIDELSHNLRALNENDRKDILEFYTEYLEDGGFTSYDACLQELGSPRKVALNAMAKHSDMLDNDNGPDSSGGSYSHSSKSDAKVIWIIILAIFSAPVTVPLAFFLLGMFIFLSLFIFFMTLVLLFVLLFVAYMTIVIGIRILLIKLTVGLTLIGMGLVSIGLLFLFIPLIRLVLHGMRVFADWIYRKITSKHDQSKDKGGRLNE